MHHVLPFELHSRTGVHRATALYNDKEVIHESSATAIIHKCEYCCCSKCVLALVIPEHIGSFSMALSLRAALSLYTR